MVLFFPPDLTKTNTVKNPCMNMEQMLSDSSFYRVTHLEDPADILTLDLTNSAFNI